MRTVIGALVLTILLVVIAGAGLIYSGLYNVAATHPHWPVTRWAMERIRTHSIKAHASGIQVPSGLDDPGKLAVGVEHYAAHCAICHGAPGVPHSEIAEGLYPPPPNLAVAVKPYNQAELFWILKHGIKMTGMPAWSGHSDAELWATVAFLGKLPAMTQPEYARLLMASLARGSHHHSGGAPHPTEDKP